MTTEPILPIAIAFAAGVLSFISPCFLPLVPVYISYLADSALTDEQGYKRMAAVLHTLLFAAGFSLIFISLGASVSFLGYLIYGYIPIIRKIGGVILIILGLQVAGLLQIPALSKEKRLHFGHELSHGYLTSFLLGSVFAFSWTPCVGPTLGAILLLAGTLQTVWQGSTLLAVYSLGLAFPFLLAALWLSAAVRLVGQWRNRLRFMPFVTGFFLIALGLLILTDQLSWLSSLISFGISF
ncbi:MAG: cytochrome c biogenesis protein CcdA [Chloroflexi bacterium]|nr:cytochrome c biogenesis protein CcdA [Chloroflexota bacterium]MCL5075632.1 cytochrome c biogenesis protein CcdA [Chloroflexota bacterium]